MPKRLTPDERESRRKEKNRKVLQGHGQYTDGNKGSRDKWAKAAELLLTLAHDIDNNLKILKLDSEPQSIEELKRAYHKAMKESHPDIGGNNSEAVEINRAYKELTKKFSVTGGRTINFTNSNKVNKKGTMENIIKSVSLYFKQGSSDKEYHLQIVDTSIGYLVNFQYGRRGGTLQTGTKTEIPVSQLSDAEKIFNQLKKSKTSKGYVEGTTGSSFTGTVSPKTSSGISPQLLNPIEESEVEKYIMNDDYIAQEKMDGERRLVNSSDTIYGINRKGNQVDLPDLIKKSLKGKYILDDEIIGDYLYAFDILSLMGKDLRGLSCVERIKILNILSFGKNISIVPTAYTTKEKRELFERLKRENKEGIVFKKASSIYQEGRPDIGGDHLKFKFYKTATFIVANITKGKRSVGLELYNGSEKVFMGKVTIPPNKDVPNVGDLIEVRYLYAYKGGAVYQPTYLGLRTDLTIKDASLSQIIYKAEHENDEE